MKIKTNLSSSQLEKAAKGLQKAAAKRAKPYKASNPAEAEMMSDMDNLFDELISDICADTAEILGEAHG